MIATTPELTSHLTKRALELEQLADSIETGVIDPAMLAPALQLLALSTRRLMEVLDRTSVAARQTSGPKR